MGPEPELPWGGVGGDFVRQPENKRLTLLSGVLSTLAANPAIRA